MGYPFIMPLMQENVFLSLLWSIPKTKCAVFWLKKLFVV